MPLYSYKCPKCGWTRTEFSPIERRNDANFTCAFHYPEWVKMERVPDAPNFSIQGFNAKNGYAK